jgi:hypothetical protein
MMASFKIVVLCPYTMKTIPFIKTDRSGQKKCRAEQSRPMQEYSPVAKNRSTLQATAAAVSLAHAKMLPIAPQ